VKFLSTSALFQYPSFPFQALSKKIPYLELILSEKSLSDFNIPLKLSSENSSKI